MPKKSLSIQPPFLPIQVDGCKNWDEALKSATAQRIFNILIWATHIKISDFLKKQEYSIEECEFLLGLFYSNRGIQLYNTLEESIQWEWRLHDNLDIDQLREIVMPSIIQAYVTLANHDFDKLITIVEKKKRKTPSRWTFQDYFWDIFWPLSWESSHTGFLESDKELLITLTQYANEVVRWVEVVEKNNSISHWSLETQKGVSVFYKEDNQYKILAIDEKPFWALTNGVQIDWHNGIPSWWIIRNKALNRIPFMRDQKTGTYSSIDVCDDVAIFDSKDPTYDTSWNMETVQIMDGDGQWYTCRFKVDAQ